LVGFFSIIPEVYAPLPTLFRSLLTIIAPPFAYDKFKGAEVLLYKFKGAGALLKAGIGLKVKEKCGFVPSGK
jgi:hypothetical protein